MTTTKAERESERARKKTVRLLRRYAKTTDSAIEAYRVFQDYRPGSRSSKAFDRYCSLSEKADEIFDALLVHLGEKPERSN